MPYSPRDKLYGLVEFFAAPGRNQGRPQRRGIVGILGSRALRRIRTDRKDKRLKESDINFDARLKVLRSRFYSKGIYKKQRNMHIS